MYLPVQYETYRLARVLSIYAIVSADHLIGKNQEHQIHAHAHAWELCYCIAGRISVRHNNNNLLLDRGQCLLIPPGVQHNVNVLQDAAEGFVVSFTCMDSYLPMLRGHITDTSERQQRQFQDILTELRSAFQLEKDALRVRHFQPSKTSPLGAEQLVCCYLEQILIEMLRTILRQEAAVGSHSDLEAAAQHYLAGQVTAYIRSHLGESLSVEQIAARFHYSRNRMSNLYKAETGLSLGRAIALERIARSKELLAANEKTVTEIAAELGYSSPQYFSRKFTQEVGCPPSQYAQTLLQTP